MPTLDEVRRRFSAASAPPEPAPVDAPDGASGVDQSKVRARRNRTAAALHRSPAPAPFAPGGAPRLTSRHYELLDGGTDALLRFGKHAGSKVSALAARGDGRHYLLWLLEQGFPEDLKAVVRRCL
jgi:hypothetical protein